MEWKSGCSYKNSIIDLFRKSREQLDVIVGGSFMTFTLGKAKILLIKIAKNGSWKPDNNQCCQKIEEVPEEVCAVSTKMDVLLDWLD